MCPKQLKNAAIKSYNSIRNVGRIDGIIPLGSKRASQQKRWGIIRTSGLRDSVPLPFKRHESQLFYQWALTFHTQKQTQHGWPNYEHDKYTKRLVNRGRTIWLNQRLTKVWCNKREKREDFFFKAINQFIHLLLQSRGSIMPTKEGTMRTARRKPVNEWAHPGCGWTEIYRLTPGRDRWRKRETKKRKVGGQAGAHITGQIELIRNRDRIISLPENSLMMLNW